VYSFGLCNANVSITWYLINCNVLATKKTVAVVLKCFMHASQQFNRLSRPDTPALHSSNSSPLSHSPSIPQLTLRPIHSTIRHLDWLRSHPLRHQPLPHLAQPRTRINLAAILTRLILRTAPQNLPDRRRARPHHAVDINRIGHFRPHVRLAAEHQVLFVSWDAREWVVGVDEAPVMEGRAVVVVRPEAGG
jgi:hypothetical protein